MKENDDNFDGSGLCDDCIGDEEIESGMSHVTIVESGENFESFHYWSKLPVELKTMVVNRLSHAAKASLSSCSKHDYNVVNQTLKIDELEISDDPEDAFISESRYKKVVSVKIDFGDKNYCESYRFLFIKRRKDTKVMWRTHRRSPLKSTMWKNCDYYEEAVKNVEQWLKRTRYSVKSLSVRMRKYPFEKSKIQLLPQCKYVFFSDKNESTFKWWLSKVPPNLKRLMLHYESDGHPLSTEFLDMDHTKMCKRLRIGPADFTDEQFLSMSGVDLPINSKKITDEAINTYIHRWINGEVRRDFEDFCVYSNCRKKTENILKGIIFRPWNNGFELEQSHLCENWIKFGRTGACYQISKKDDPWTSATLNIADNGVQFVVTGKKVKCDGKIFTVYDRALIY